MKLIVTLSSVVALSLSLSTGAFAAEKKAKKEGAPAASADAKKSESKPAEAGKPAEGAKEGKPLPMNSRADSIDAAGKSFTMKRKDGVEVKHVLAANAEIKNNGADAKFEDIKVGDTVAGLRVKKSDTEYEVTKITKFGPAAPKEKKGEKKAEAGKTEGSKPAEKK